MPRRKLDPRYDRWPHAAVEGRVGWLRWAWSCRSGLSGRVVESGTCVFRWRADRAATAAYRRAIGVRPTAAGRPRPVDPPVPAHEEGQYA
jgi:hypothetical protein